MEQELLHQALSLRDFSPTSWRDWALIPFHLTRWWLWWWIMILTLWLQGLRWKLFKRGSIMSRHTDPTPTICPYCLWAGPVRWLAHGYACAWDEADVEPVSYCPRCGEDL